MAPCEWMLYVAAVVRWDSEAFVILRCQIGGWKGDPRAYRSDLIQKLLGQYHGWLEQIKCCEREADQETILPRFGPQGLHQARGAKCQVSPICSTFNTLKGIPPGMNVSKFELPTPYGCRMNDL